MTRQRIQAKIQRAWFESHDSWWLHHPPILRVGDVGRLTRGGRWEPITHHPVLDGTTVGKDLPSGAIILYTHTTTTCSLDTSVAASALATLTAGGPPVGGGASGRRARRISVGALASAAATTESEAFDHARLRDSIERAADGWSSWQPDWLVVSYLRVATTEQNRAQLVGASSQVRLTLSAKVPEMGNGELGGTYATEIAGSSTEVLPAGRPIEAQFYRADRRFWKWGPPTVGIVEAGRRRVRPRAIWTASPQFLSNCVAAGEQMFVPFTYQSLWFDQREQRAALVPQLARTATALIALGAGSAAYAKKRMTK